MSSKLQQKLRSFLIQEMGTPAENIVLEITTPGAHTSNLSKFISVEGKGNDRSGPQINLNKKITQNDQVQVKLKVNHILGEDKDYFMGKRILGFTIKNQTTGKIYDQNPENNILVINDKVELSKDDKTLLFFTGKNGQYAYPVINVKNGQLLIKSSAYAQLKQNKLANASYQGSDEGDSVVNYLPNCQVSVGSPLGDGQWLPVKAIVNGGGKSVYQFCVLAVDNFALQSQFKQVPSQNTITGKGFEDLLKQPWFSGMGDDISKTAQDWRALQQVLIDTYTKDKSSVISKQLYQAIEAKSKAANDLLMVEQPKGLLIAPSSVGQESDGVSLKMLRSYLNNPSVYQVTMTLNKAGASEPSLVLPLLDFSLMEKLRDNPHSPYYHFGVFSSGGMPDDLAFINNHIQLGSAYQAMITVSTVNHAQSKFTSQAVASWSASLPLQSGTGQVEFVKSDLNKAQPDLNHNLSFVFMTSFPKQESKLNNELLYPLDKHVNDDVLGYYQNAFQAADLKLKEIMNNANVQFSEAYKLAESSMNALIQAQADLNTYLADHREWFLSLDAETQKALTNLSNVNAVSTANLPKPDEDPSIGFEIMKNDVFKPLEALSGDFNNQITFVANDQIAAYKKLIQDTKSKADQLVSHQAVSLQSYFMKSDKLTRIFHQV